MPYLKPLISSVSFDDVTAFFSSFFRGYNGTHLLFEVIWVNMFIIFNLVPCLTKHISLRAETYDYKLYHYIFSLCMIKFCVVRERIICVIFIVLQSFININYVWFTWAKIRCRFGGWMILWRHVFEYLYIWWIIFVIVTVIITRLIKCKYHNSCSVLIWITLIFNLFWS